MLSVEEGDDKSVAEKAAADALEVAKKLDRKSILVYPFAHLSNNLADPKSRDGGRKPALQGLRVRGIEVKRSPFGWNKKLTVAVKGHPLAEQGRSYGKDDEKKTYKKVKPAGVNTSIVRKSDWSGPARGTTTGP